MNFNSCALHARGPPAGLQCYWWERNNCATVTWLAMMEIVTHAAGCRVHPKSMAGQVIEDRPSMMLQHHSEVLRGFHAYCVFAHRVTPVNAAVEADPFLNFAFHESLSDLIGLPDSVPTEAECLFSCQHVRPGLTADGKPKPVHDRSHLVATVKQDEDVLTKCQMTLECVTGALPVLVYVLYVPGSTTTPGQLALHLAPDPLVPGSNVRTPIYAFCAGSVFTGAHFSLIAGTGDGRLYDYDSMAGEAKLVARPSQRPFFTRIVESQVRGPGMTYVIYRLVVKDVLPTVTLAQANTAANAPTLEVEKSRLMTGSSLASSSIISAQPSSASSSPSCPNGVHHAMDTTLSATDTESKTRNLHCHPFLKVAQVNNEGTPPAALRAQVAPPASLPPVFVPPSPGLPHCVSNIEFLCACTGDKGILFKDPPLPSANTSWLIEQATLLTSRVLFHLDAHSHRVHGNEPGRPQMWYFCHSGTGHGGRRVARVTPAAQEPECVAAHDALLHHCMGDTIQEFLVSGQATIAQTGILIENVDYKNTRSTCTSSTGRNPEDTYAKYRKYSGEKDYVADRASLTASELLYLKSSGHPRYSWRSGTLLADVPGRQGDVHVDTQLPVDQGYVVVIVILTEHGGTLASTIKRTSRTACHFNSMCHLFRAFTTFDPIDTFTPSPGSPHGLCSIERLEAR